MTRTSAMGLAIGALLLALGLVAALWPELPNWRPGGTRSIPAASLTHAESVLVCPETGSRIGILGDSHVAGEHLEEHGGQAGSPFGKVLERALGDRAAVAIYGIGGQTAQQGEQAWQDREIAANIVILVYGTNDAAPRGWLRDKVAVPVVDYKASLTRQIGKWRDGERQVILMPSPPAGSSAIMERLSPYRAAALAVGEAEGVVVLDPADAFASCPAQQPVLSYDAMHMNAAGHWCLGHWLARQLCPLDSEGP